MAGIIDALFGLNGVPRYQTWPERALRSGPELAENMLQGKFNPAPATPGTLTEEDVARQRYGAGSLTDQAFNAAGAATGSSLPYGAAGGSLPEDALGTLFLKRLERNPAQTNDAHFHIVDEAGQPKLYANFDYYPNEKKLHLSDIGPIGAQIYDKGMANQFGHTDMRNLLRALKQEFPEAETLQGYRVTGARAEDPSQLGMYPMAKVPLPQGPVTPIGGTLPNPQDEMVLALSRWQREAEAGALQKAQAQQQGQAFQP